MSRKSNQPAAGTLRPTVTGKKTIKRRDPADASVPKATKYQTILALLGHPKGTTIDAIMKVTGWQQHSVRGFLAGTVRKKRGLTLVSKKIDGQRVYRAREEAGQVQVNLISLGGLHRLTMARPNATAIERELDRIRSLGGAELRAEWQRHHHGAPPKLSRDLLALALGYQLQEREHGGLSKSTRRKLQTVAKGLQATGRWHLSRPEPQTRDALSPGLAWPHPYCDGDGRWLRA